MDAEYWSSRYQKKQTGWDLGAASKSLLKLFKKLNKEDKILIPGCGNAYEAEYLFEAGYKNIHIMDFAPEPLSAFKERNKTFPTQQVIHDDFFSHREKYDAIIEQTFFCAIHPKLRRNYVDQSHDLLNENGILIGVLFNRDFDGGPPFGGNSKEYLHLFGEKFETVEIQNCADSVEPRLGTEVTIRCQKKSTKKI